jgi:hypothetical protein
LEPTTVRIVLATLLERFVVFSRPTMVIVRARVLGELLELLKRIDSMAVA